MTAATAVGVQTEVLVAVGELVAHAEAAVVTEGALEMAEESAEWAVLRVKVGDQGGLDGTVAPPWLYHTAPWLVARTEGMVALVARAALVALVECLVGEEASVATLVVTVAMVVPAPPAVRAAEASGARSYIRRTHACMASAVLRWHSLSHLGGSGRWRELSRCLESGGSWPHAQKDRRA